VQTLFAGSFSVGVAASAFIFGRVIERYGYQVAFAAAGACAAVAVLLLWLAPEENGALVSADAAIPQQRAASR
jgi:predicted MFS family arabinose efflux permease